MANEKRLNTRIILKHDSEANWNLATNFYPELGEILIYDPDETHSYPRFKIGKGDKTTNPNGLEFVKIDWDNVLNTPDIPSTLADLLSDETHRVVTDAQIGTWNGKVSTNDLNAAF